MMNLREAKELYKRAIERAIERKFTIEECVDIMALLGVHPSVITSVTSLVCEKPGEYISLGKYEPVQFIDIPNRPERLNGLTSNIPEYGANSSLNFDE